MDMWKVWQVKFWWIAYVMINYGNGYGENLDAKVLTNL